MNSQELQNNQVVRDYMRTHRFTTVSLERPVELEASQKLFGALIGGNAPVITPPEIISSVTDIKKLELDLEILTQRSGNNILFEIIYLTGQGPEVVPMSATSRNDDAQIEYWRLP